MVSKLTVSHTSSIFEYKFVLPPTVAILFVYSANPHLIIDLLQISNGQNIGAFILGALGIFGVGFAISSVGYVFINFFILDGIEELDIWTNLENRPFVQRQVAKRWDMFAANVDAVIAMLAALTIVALTSCNGAHVVVGTALCAVFILNAIWGYLSISKLWCQISPPK